MHKLFNRSEDSSAASKELHKGHAVVLFYMETCPHCIAMKPEWNKFIKKYGKNRKIISVERSAMPTEFQSEVYSFPTVVLVTNGQIIDKHSGERTEKDFANFSSKIASKTGKARTAKSLKKKSKTARRVNK